MATRGKKKGSGYKLIYAGGNEKIKLGKVKSETFRGTKMYAVYTKSGALASNPTRNKKEAEKDLERLNYMAKKIRNARPGEILAYYPL